MFFRSDSRLVKLQEFSSRGAFLLSPRSQIDARMRRFLAEHEAEQRGLLSDYRYMPSLRAQEIGPFSVAPTSSSDSLRQCYRTSQGGMGELARRHRLAEQEALSDVEAQLSRSDEVGAALDAFGDRPNTVFVREVDDTAADGLLQAVIAKTGDELAVHLELAERNGRKGS